MISVNFNIKEIYPFRPTFVGHAQLEPLPDPAARLPFTDVVSLSRAQQQRPGPMTHPGVRVKPGGVAFGRGKQESAARTHFAFSKGRVSDLERSVE